MVSCQPLPEMPKNEKALNGIKRHKERIKMVSWLGFSPFSSTTMVWVKYLPTVLAVNISQIL